MCFRKMALAAGWGSGRRDLVSLKQVAVTLAQNGKA